MSYANTTLNMSNMKRTLSERIENMDPNDLIENSSHVKYFVTKQTSALSVRMLD